METLIYLSCFVTFGALAENGLEITTFKKLPSIGVSGTIKSNMENLNEFYNRTVHKLSSTTAMNDPRISPSTVKHCETEKIIMMDEFITELETRGMTVIKVAMLSELE